MPRSSALSSILGRRGSCFRAAAALRGGLRRQPVSTDWHERDQGRLARLGAGAARPAPRSRWRSAFEDVTQRFRRGDGDPVASVSLCGRARRDRRAARPIRLRQDDAAAARRRASSGRARAACCWKGAMFPRPTASWSRSIAASASSSRIMRCSRISPCGENVRFRPARAGDGRGRGDRAAGAGARVGLARSRRFLSAYALGRRAAARRAGARDRAATGHVADGRAFLAISTGGCATWCATRPPPCWRKPARLRSSSPMIPRMRCGIADRIVLMRAGRIVADRARARSSTGGPASLFAARFFCDFTEVEGRVSDGAAGHAVRALRGPGPARRARGGRLHPAASRSGIVPKGYYLSAAG